MTNSDPGAAGMQPDHPKAAPKVLEDGIITMSGTVSFTASATSIVVEITPAGAEGSGFNAYGAQGNSIPPGTPSRPAARTGDTITSSGLAAAAVRTNYTVEIRYTEGSTLRTKRGTVNGSLIDQIPKADVPITLS